MASAKLAENAQLRCAIAKCMDFLDDLVNEFSKNDLAASRMQEVAEKRRTKRVPDDLRDADVDVVIRCLADRGPDSEPVQLSEPERFTWLGLDNPAWHFLTSWRLEYLD